MTQSALQCFDGRINVESSSNAIPYHFNTIFSEPIHASCSESLALLACKVSCVTVDVLRRRRPLEAMEKMATKDCIARVKTLSEVLESFISDGLVVMPRMYFAPADPKLVHGIFLEPGKVEVNVNLHVGSMSYWTDLVFHRCGSRWICTMADIG